MSEMNDTVEQDKAMMQSWMAEDRVQDFEPQFAPGPGIQKLALRFDIEKLREALNDVSGSLEEMGDGFSAFGLTRRPGVEKPTANDLSGLFWTRVNDSYQETPREEEVDEFLFTEFNPALKGSYFEHVHQELIKRFPIGRMRVLGKQPYNCNSWHRDPEPRLHIPIVSNPGSLFVVNHHVTHMPADGSVYFTDTRGYHTAMNGGEDQRVHIVAALPWKAD